MRTRFYGEDGNDFISVPRGTDKFILYGKGGDDIIYAPYTKNGIIDAGDDTDFISIYGGKDLDVYDEGPAGPLVVDNALRVAADMYVGHTLVQFDNSTGDVWGGNSDSRYELKNSTAHVRGYGGNDDFHVIFDPSLSHNNMAVDENGTLDLGSIRTGGGADTVTVEMRGYWDGFAAKLNLRDFDPHSDTLRIIGSGNGGVLVSGTDVHINQVGYEGVPERIILSTLGGQVRDGAFSTDGFLSTINRSGAEGDGLKG